MPQLDLARAALLAAASFGAGLVNAVAGGGSLLSFPALLLAGYPTVTANVTNTVALVPGYIGGAVAYRPELRGQGARIRALVPVSVAGAVVGAALLVAGPAALFQRLVPWLIIGSCALLLLQPRLKAFVARRHRSRPPRTAPLPLLAGQGLAAVYGAYFGAGLGVITLALLGVALDDDLQRVNALKALLQLVINVVAVAAFVVVASVGWAAVAIMAPVSYLGGILGVRVARRLDERTLRLSVVTFGMAVGIRLAL